MAEFDDELDRMASDPAFAARVRAAYSGRSTLDDVVWWLRHPLQPGPSGRAAPLVEREALARQVYARAAAPEDAEHRLVEADAAIAADRDALSQAFEVAVTPAPVEIDDAERAAVTGPTEDTEPTPRRRLPVVALAVVIAAALVTGGVVAGRASAPRPAASKPATASAPAVFDRPATQDDAPPIGAATDFVVESYRKLQDVPSPASSLENNAVAATVYAVRSRDGRACLLAESGSTVVAVTCVTDADFPAEGLRIYWWVGSVLYGTTWAANGEMVDSGRVGAGSSKDNVG